MAKSIRDKTPVDVTSTKPELDTSLESDFNKKAKEDKNFELELNIKLEQCIKMKDIVKENQMKEAALIWKYCSTQIQVRVQAHTTYNSIRDDPIGLLKLIKQMMHDPERAKYGYASIKEALSRMINMKQHESESLIEYQKRVKQASEILKSHIGDEFLHNFVTKIPEYATKTADEKTVNKEVQCKVFIAYLVLSN